ncbi:hypothetical protein CEXT_370091 [Caerostris extrusa]|uniref:Uncharacterized protein n=1 Tax=Caerostris extrusa TaxID=172846 RepID=A0AAV4NDQ4_CAEEX|nr:hypothetical protein CEXT_370091 [Caerostris extrusa]
MGPIFGDYRLFAHHQQRGFPIVHHEASPRDSPAMNIQENKVSNKGPFPHLGRLSSMQAPGRENLKRVRIHSFGQPLEAGRQRKESVKDVFKLRVRTCRIFIFWRDKCMAHPFIPTK